MEKQPAISTQRLLLRAFLSADAKAVQKLAGAAQIAATTANIPHPYTDGLAESWIADTKKSWNAGTLCTYAITLSESNALIGAISLMGISKGSAEIGYWIGVDYWRQGFCTEACLALVNFGFSHLKISRIYAHHLSRNPASGKILIKSGLQHIGHDSIVWPKTGKLERVERYEINSE